MCYIIGLNNYYLVLNLCITFTYAFTVHFVVHEICTYCTVYTVLYMKSVHAIQCILYCI